MEQTVPQVADSGASAVWIVVSGSGVQVAGTADLPGTHFAPEELDDVRRLTAPDGAEGATAVRPELARAVEQVRTPSDATAFGPLSGGRGDAEPIGDVELPAPLLLRVDSGRIFGWSRRLGTRAELGNRHLDLLVRVGVSDRPIPHDDLAAHVASNTLAELLTHGFLVTASPLPTVSVAVETPAMIRRAAPPSTGSGSHDPSANGPVPAEPAVVPPLPASGTTRTHRWWSRLTKEGRRRAPTIATTAITPTDRRAPVWPVTCADTEVGNALGLGMIVAAAKAHDGGHLTESYDFQPIRITAESALADIGAAGRPGILMLSTYSWSLGANLELAAKVKGDDPETVVVFGGPSAPKYPQDALVFLDRHPQVDVIVRGEGEVTATELLVALGGDLSDLEPLTGVAGLTVRVGDRVVRTEERPRLDDLNVVPSPYLTGLFDHLNGQLGIWAIETNRGCPYGCTFCDWGSATKSRIRKYDMERVTAELDWLAGHGVQAIFAADANFGIFERDLDLTRHVAKLHAERGAPVSFIASFAKNTTKYTVPIIRTLIDAGLSGDVAIAFQTTDSATLDNISRSNIKLENYDKLARDVRADGLPILADVMIGLPGSTIETLKADLQHCVNSDVTARVFGTLVLPNSPMNDPEYRELHEIRTDSYDQIVSTTSFGPADREEMVRFRDVFRWADHFGVLRHLLRFEAHRSDRRELDLLWDMRERATARPLDYPLLSFAFVSGRRYLIEPMSWQAFYREVGSLLVDEFGAPDTSGLRTVLTVQEALMPSAGRSLPESIPLDHDYVSFYREVLRPRDGVAVDRQLADYGPAVLTVEDPDGISPGCLREMFQIEHSPEGARSLVHEGEFWQTFNWELESPLQRALRDQIYDSANSLPVLEKGTAPLDATNVSLDKSDPVEV